MARRALNNPERRGMQFREPILAHREREMATVVRCLRERTVRALRGDGDEFGGGEGDAAAFRLAQVRKMPSWPRSWANFSLF